VKRRFDKKKITYVHSIYTDVSINSSNYTESCQKFCASNGPNWIDDILLAILIFIWSNFFFLCFVLVNCRT